VENKKNILTSGGGGLTHRVLTNVLIYGNKSNSKK